MTKLLKVLIILSWAFYAITLVVLTLLALDAFTVPYLTPLAHFAKWFISPIVPLVMPLWIGGATKIYKHAPFPSRKQCLFVAGAVILCQTPRVVGDLGTLYDWKNVGNGSSSMGTLLVTEGFCELRECTSSWVEAALMVVVVLCESMGVNWDVGYVHRFIDALAEESIQKEMMENVKMEAESMEKGEVIEDKDR